MAPPLQAPRVWAGRGTDVILTDEEWGRQCVAGMNPCVLVALKDTPANQFGSAIGTDLLSQPDRVASEFALLSAAWFWNSRNLNQLADGGAGTDVITAITKKVNGGTIGLDDRTSHFKSYYALLS